jgi:hypothetical protein
MQERYTFLYHLWSNAQLGIICLLELAYKQINQIHFLYCKQNILEGFVLVFILIKSIQKIYKFLKYNIQSKNIHRMPNLFLKVCPVSKIMNNNSNNIVIV